MEQHARYRRDLQQGGCIPAHFTTLTTAIYHWADLHAVLEEYERRTTEKRHGRRDPPEPGEAALPDGKRRVLQYSGVVAWYCALKLELYASYVLCYDDVFGVYEWGSGGIVHMHLIGWRFPGLGRYDCHDGDVPSKQRREDAKTMACQHGAEISEWYLARQDDWQTKDGFDEDLTEMHKSSEYGPQALTDDSDGDSNTEEEAEPAVVAGMRDLRALLEDPQWHPSALPAHLKRMLLTTRSVLVRRMTRWYYTRLQEKCYLHDRHGGDPLTVPPVYGDDSESEGPEQEPEEEEEEKVTISQAEVRVLTWNTHLQTELTFVLAAARDADIICLQEVTPASAAWLEDNLGDQFDLFTPPSCGGAWDAEDFGVAIAVRRAALAARAPKLRLLNSDQMRSLMTVHVEVRSSNLSVLVSTAHLESGATCAELRQQQMVQVSEFLHDDTVDGAIFAADFNLAAREVVPSRLGDDAWVLAGQPEDKKWTWCRDNTEGRGVQKRRFDRIVALRRKAVAGSEGGADSQTLELCTGTFALLESSQSDHHGVQCSLTLVEARSKQRRRRVQGLGEPLRVGARARVGCSGVARRPKKTEACAKVEPHTEKADGGGTYYCGKQHEKPRIHAGDAAVLEDPRRKGLWRLNLPRNCAYVNSHLAAAAICLGANSDCQPILTAKGVADYVCKYVTKYGAGQSVTKRIASLLDDIVSRVPVGKTMTVASLLSKAFIATAVPAALCCLEAWHILWSLPRTVTSRFFKGLNMDGLTGVKNPKEVPKEGSPEAAATSSKVTKKTDVQHYAGRMKSPCKNAALRSELPKFNLLRFTAETELKSAGKGEEPGIVRRKKPRVMNLKPYLQLDLTKPGAAKHAKMALRMLRPWQGEKEDPMLLGDEEAMQQLEEFAMDKQTPRWLRKRFEHHNRQTRRLTAQPAAPTTQVAPDAETPSPTTCDATSDSTKLAAVRGHGLLWDRVDNSSPWTVREALQHAKFKPNARCVKEMLQQLGDKDAKLPRSRASLVDALVLHILWVDLQPYTKKGRGRSKDALPRPALWNAVQAWIDYHQSELHDKERKELKGCTSYAELWNAFKRVALEDCGLNVVAAPSKRKHFEKPYYRPKGPHDKPQAGTWRQPVTAACPWLASKDDVETERNEPRPRAYVRCATHEQSMGAGALPEFEVPLPEDEDALECPDKGTKVEWDALWPMEDTVKRAGFGNAEDLRVSAEKLRLVKPERDGGATDAEYAAALRQFPNPRATEAAVALHDLDPTQRAFADIVLSWASAVKAGGARAERHPPELHAVLLGTAGTGKTTTLQAVLERLKQNGFDRVLVTAYTGVASSNVGGGAQTLHSLFQLHKVSPTSGELQSLEGKDLEKLSDALDGLRLLVIDEVSMVSRTMLADIDRRLKEWRAFRKHPAQKEPFGGVGVLLAGDFGQLPPTKAEQYSLIGTKDMQGTHSARANLGKRLFQRFTKVVRLRRIHRQPGASAYKESLIRLRDAAMTKEDWALWQQHDLAEGPLCKLTRQQREKLEKDVTHLFAENAGAGQRNGEMAGEHAQRKGRHILRVASRDNTAAASRQPCDMFGQLRRVIHVLEGAPAMVICNMRTPAGLVNGALGTVVGAVLRRNAADRDIRGAVSATDVAYVVLDIPKYCGPVLYPDHPTWVPIEPAPQRHKRFVGWERMQLPLVLAWGITIHKSQGLTFPNGSVVDFAHHPNTQPVANVGLAFVAMSRGREWCNQAFRHLPDFWEFRKVLKDKLFQWRGVLEKRMDELHDETMSHVLGKPFTVEEDVRLHKEWSEQKKGAALTDAEMKDISDMLGVRGLLPAKDYPDEPKEDRRGIRGGGGRKPNMGMKPLAGGPRRKTPASKRSPPDGEACDMYDEREGPSGKRSKQGEDCDMYDECDDFRTLEAEAVGQAMEDASFDVVDGFDFGGFDDDDGAAEGATRGQEELCEDAEQEGQCQRDVMQGRADAPMSLQWGARYFEKQLLAECGRHALNNLVGSPLYSHSDMEEAAVNVVKTTQEDTAEHIRAAGWYSHSVLATVLRQSRPAQWKLLLNRLPQNYHKVLMLDEDIVGALVNKHNAHWVALVKHNDLLWLVDSCATPVPMDSAAFQAFVRSHPDTFAVARKGRPGD